MPKVAPAKTKDTVRIERLGALGDGLAEGAAGPVAVPFTAPGDLVEIDGQTSGRRRTARLHRLLEAGPDRTEAPCPHFGRCGGCRVQHIAPGAYADWKDGLWRQALSRAGIGQAVLDQARVRSLATVPPQSRRRARLAVRKGTVGFRIERTHRIEPIEHCSVLEPALLQTAQAIAKLPRLNGCEISLTCLDDGIEAVVHGLDTPGYDDLQDLAEAAARLDLARLTHLDDRGSPVPIAHRREGILRFGGTTVIAPPAPFLQATRQGEDILGQHVLSWLATANHIADLYCGCGTFALPLAARGQGKSVLAVDRDGPAISALAAAARQSLPTGRLACETRNLASDPLAGRELQGLDGVVFDPPRAGAQAQAEALAVSEVRDVVAVSCNPVSFARDAAILLEGGYRLVEIAPLDQFLWTAHLELAAHFRR